MGSTNYDHIVIDPDEDPKDYHYTHRRAEIWELIQYHGTPRQLDTEQLAERYGISRKMVYNDIDAIGEWVQENLGPKAELRTKALHEKATNELIENGDWEAAWRIEMELWEWIERRGVKYRAPEQLEADITTRQAALETEEYELITDDSEIETALANAEDIDTQ